MEGEAGSQASEHEVISADPKIGKLEKTRPAPGEICWSKVKRVPGKPGHIEKSVHFRENPVVLGKPRRFEKAVSFQESRIVSRKPCRFKKTMSYRENARQSRPSLHAIVEKLTANGLFVVRRSLLLASGRRSPGQNRER
jgi:hypothetical protein